MEDAFVRRFLEIRIADRYQLCKRLGAGTFGDVYLGRDVQTDEDVAVKLEHHDVAASLLSIEADIYDSLKGRSGIPRVFWNGHHCDYLIMVFELLGPNLEDLFQYCGGYFSLKTTLMLVDQLLRRVECLHISGHLHRDIKPENFLLGTGKRGNVVYVTDLGLADYRNTRDDHPRQCSPTPASRHSLVGTCRYASINAHLALAYSCRDDLESLGYMVLYFLRGSLPWQGLQATNRQEKYRRVFEQKQKTGVDELCRDLPPEFATYMSYLRQLENPNRPDYAYLRGLFSRLSKRSGFEHDHVFDWTTREFQRLSGENNAKMQSTRKKQTK